MRIWALLVALIAAFGVAGMASAQDRAWVQIEAQPSLAKAEERARAYAAVFPDVEGFRLRSGWYAVMLGPFAPAEAAGKLAQLKSENLIPADSYIADGALHREQFWPAAGSAAADPTVAESLLSDPQADTSPATEALPTEADTDQALADVTDPEAAPEPVAEPEETPQQARATEAALTRDERMDLQRALAWYGFYASAIDGAFGPGTRNSMATWQEASGYEATGILTTRQRATLVANYQADQAEFGFQTLNEPEAGIEITLPMSLVQFDRYEPPFVHFSEKDGSGLQVMLISEPGDKNALAGLYDILQTLEVVPANGAREKTDKSFTITGQSADIESYAFAETRDGMVKGYLVVWKPQDADRMSRILPALKSSFRAVGAKALDPGLVPMEEAARAGLLAGLEVRRPKLSRSGFFVDASGLVVTTTQAVESCTRITLDHETAATVTFADNALGLALLTPSAPLAPPAVAGFAAFTPRPGTELAAAGYSYEDKLPSPAVTFGTLEEAKGLNGEDTLIRLSLPALPGDAGAAVLDPSGAAVGMILPATTGERVLPEGVVLALSSAAIVARLAEAGHPVATGPALALATPDALNAQAMGMTVLVSCWQD